MHESREGDARRMLEGGIPADAPACNYHQRLREHPLPIDLLIPTTVTTQGAFMPLCKNCEAAPYNQASLDLLARCPGVLDFCSCASTAMESDCCYCAIAFWELDLQAATLMRTREIVDENGNPKVVELCGCGRVVRAPYTTLQCVSCPGITSVTTSGTAPNDGVPTPIQANGGTEAPAPADAMDTDDLVQLNNHEESLDADPIQSPTNTISPITAQVERTSIIEGLTESGDEQDAPVASPRHVTQVHDPTPEQLGAIGTALETAGDRLVSAVEAAS